VGKPMKEVFWLPVDSAWFKIAEGLKVRYSIINASLCLTINARKIVLIVKFL
jgi:hypothetical protein